MFLLLWRSPKKIKKINKIQIQIKTAGVNKSLHMRVRRACSRDRYCQRETVIAEKMKLFHVPQHYRGIW